MNNINFKLQDIVRKFCPWNKYPMKHGKHITEWLVFKKKNDAYKLKSKLDFVPRIFSFFWPLLTEISYYFRICFYVKTWISRDLNLKLNGCLGTMSYVGLSVIGKINRPILLFRASFAETSFIWPDLFLTIFNQKFLT